MSPVILLLLLTGVLLFVSSKKIGDARAGRVLSAAAILAMLGALAIAAYDLIIG